MLGVAFAISAILGLTFLLVGEDGPEEEQDNEHSDGADGDTSPQKESQDSSLLAELYDGEPKELVKDVVVLDGTDREGDAETHIGVISIADTDIENFPSHFSDWTQNTEVVVIEASEGQSIDIEVDRPGSLHVMNASFFDYGDRGDAIERHTGANVYFVPDGQQFGNDLRWSETGAVLYSDADAASESSETGGIKLIARVNTGIWSYLNNGTEVETLSDSRVFDFQITSSMGISLS
ncbi:hypothetical protein JANAI62_37710 [Jannaschia pagri]|uniref:Uncharacterized protein n=1 Tax=Jannaschia pagri TaxID=2829797 RepID=A0ABQ4NRX2_9RHOB|nr:MULTISPECIES: hypothetical protein [unclassified Jannaschia]GIT93322.1 hypothetical protein JANAI61_37800 [Jannaschia sp. AI_61]GIT97148.1 hypothetical protein JANAI62_37710 [Jannaschia sp. AI_62]